MLESRKLMRDLDNFDKLTNIFIYGDPANSDLGILEKSLKSNKKKDLEDP